MKKVILSILPAFLIFSGNLIAGEIIKVSPVKKIIKVFSNPGDYFRSAASGDWGSIATWESSPDNGVTPWAAATLTPTSLAATISVRNTHTVTVSTNQDMDEVIIESGGILLHTGGTLTVNDNGAGDDINVQGGGVFTLESNSNGPAFAPGATAIINSNGILRLSASGLTAAGAGVHASNFVYSNASVLEYTLGLAFSTDNVVFFPNVNSPTIPIFRITTNVGNVGANSNTIINGLFEANGNITFQGTGTKTFRNGIIGTGTVTGDVAAGKFIINGTTASLGGSGGLTLPTAGMDIGSNTTVTMTSDKSVSGNIAFLTNALIILGTFNLTMTSGTFSGFSSTSHVVTDGSGKLVFNNVQAFPSFSIYPIGGNTTTYSPLAIANADGLNFGARVEIGINPPIRFPIAAVNRTWVVRPSATPTNPVNVNFLYSNTAGNALFNYNTTVEQGFYTGVWNVINTGIVQAGGPLTYQVATIVNIFAANTDAPMVIANIPAILEPGNLVQLTAQKQHEKAILSWSVLYHPLVNRFIVELSADGSTYQSIADLPATDLHYTDLQPLPGRNYYRIKTIEKDGRSTYSNVAVIINALKGFDLINITPNPVVNGSLKLVVSAAQKIPADILITDMQGRLLQKQTIVLTAGSNIFTIDVSKLARGTYYVYGNTAEGRSRAMRFVVQ